MSGALNWIAIALLLVGIACVLMAIRASRHGQSNRLLLVIAV